MILAEKITNLRKKAGWSQEELAEQLHVTRQSVSKWESAQSVPDMNKVVQMSRLFGVSTDYLLKDELEAPEPVPAEDTDCVPALRRISMEEASAYLALRRAAAPKMALATFLCIVSPIALLLLGALSAAPQPALSENAAAGIGLCVLFVLVAAGVTLFLQCSTKVRDFAFLENEPFETEYGVSGMVKTRKAAFQSTFFRLNIAGTVLCILSAVPLFIALCFDASDFIYVASVCALLFIAACGCFAFVYAGTQNNAMAKLLEEGDYTRAEKSKSSLKSAVSGVYWLLVTAVYLVCTFAPFAHGDPKQTWIIWPVAGVLYAALLAILQLSHRSR